MVHVAKSPLGPYVKISGDRACQPINTTFSLKEDFGFNGLGDGAPTPGQGCQYLFLFFLFSFEYMISLICISDMRIRV